MPVVILQITFLSYSKKSNPFFSGEFKVHIEACDLQQACVVHTAPDTILVSEKQMTEAELNTAVSDVTMLLKTGKRRRTIILCLGFCCTM